MKAKEIMSLIERHAFISCEIWHPPPHDMCEASNKIELRELTQKLQEIADSLPRLPVGQRVIVDGESIGRIVEYSYVIEYEDEPSNFSQLTEDDGVEPIDEDKQ